MKLRYKILYMSFGAGLVVLGMVLNSLVSGDAEAQGGLKDGIFKTVICEGLYLTDGSKVISERGIDQRGSSNLGIQRVYLDPEVHADVRVTKAIQNSDAIIFAPGDLFTSLLPNLLVKGVPEAILSSSARLIVVANLHTKIGETVGYKLSHFLSTLAQYLGGDTKFDCVIANNEPIKAYMDNPAVEVDIAASNRWAREIRLRPLVSLERLASHDPERTADAIMEVLSY